jgi:hypothetical protein
MLAHARVQVPITTCGQVVERGQVGILMADLACGHQWGTCRACVQAGCAGLGVPCSGPPDCPDPAVNVCDGSEAVPSVGVYVVPGARLYLNGHSIGGVQFGIYGARPDNTGTSARVRIVGPGTVASTREATRGSNLSLSDGVTLTDSLYGVVASKARLKDVDTSGNTIGVSVFQALRATRVTADGNRYAGFVSYAGARLSSCHATGNAVIDVTTELRPRVAATTCDHSAALEETGQPGIYEPTGPPWGVCAGD